MLKYQCDSRSESPLIKEFLMRLDTVGANAGFFSGEAPSSLPLTFEFGEPENAGKKLIESSTQFQGEETMTHPGGGYDTGA